MKQDYVRCFQFFLIILTRFCTNASKESIPTIDMPNTSTAPKYPLLKIFVLASTFQFTFMYKLPENRHITFQTGHVLHIALQSHHLLFFCHSVPVPRSPHLCCKRCSTCGISSIPARRFYVSENRALSDCSDAGGTTGESDSHPLNFPNTPG